MVTFKPIKYKHRRAALALYAELDGDIANLSSKAAVSIEEQITALMMATVEAWDFCDVETGEPIPVGEPDELSDEQYTDLAAAFNATMDVSVKKKNESSASSGQRTPRKEKRRA